MHGMCALLEVSRAGYYRHWRASAPRPEETELRDALQKLKPASDESASADAPAKP